MVLTRRKLCLNPLFAIITVGYHVAMLDIFGDILGPKVRGRMDKMAGWAGAGRFYVWTRISPINLGQVGVWTKLVSGAEIFQDIGSP